MCITVIRGVKRLEPHYLRECLSCLMILKQDPGGVTALSTVECKSKQRGRMQ